MNIICDREDIPRKVAALRQRCEEADRDPVTLPTSYLASVVMTETEKEAQVVVDRVPPERRSRVFIGTPDQVAAGLKQDVLDAGIGGLTINMIFTGHQPGAVAAAGKVLRPLVS
jgi:alkanesulfonate monooxygenase SsuD/methylene tetrahydromethanopterin reductase-like flavin-dependent oxidoreductase (luciferase family)